MSHHIPTHSLYVPIYFSARLSEKGSKLPKKKFERPKRPQFALPSPYNAMSYVPTRSLYLGTVLSSSLSVSFVLRCWKPRHIQVNVPTPVFHPPANRWARLLFPLTLMMMCIVLTSTVFFSKITY